MREYIAGEDNAEPPTELVEFEPAFEVKTLWSRRVGAGVEEQYLKLRPVVVGGRVFAASRKGQVAAYAASSGERIWETDTDTPISGGPGAGHGLALVGTSEGEVVALSSEAGAILWRSKLSSEILAPPQAARGVVVVRTADGKLFGLSSEDGTRLWVYDRSVPILTLRGTSAPALGPEVAVAGFDSGRLVAVSSANGQPLWEARIAVPRGRSELERIVDIDADPVILGDTVYVATYQGRVAAVDLASGDIIWHREMSSHAGLEVDSENLYVTDALGHVWALDRFTAASVWRQQRLQARGVTSPAHFRDFVVVGDAEGYVHWLRRDDGQFVARSQVSGGIIAPPVPGNAAVLIYDRGGTLTALGVE